MIRPSSPAFGRKNVGTIASDKIGTQRGSAAERHRPTACAAVPSATSQRAHGGHAEQPQVVAGRLEQRRHGRRVTGRVGREVVQGRPSGDTGDLKPGAEEHRRAAPGGPPRAPLPDEGHRRERLERDRDGGADREHGEHDPPALADRRDVGVGVPVAARRLGPQNAADERDHAGHRERDRRDAEPLAPYRIGGLLVRRFRCRCHGRLLRRCGAISEPPRAGSTHLGGPSSGCTCWHGDRRPPAALQ